MNAVPTLVIRPVTSLGASQVLVLRREAAGAETEMMRLHGGSMAAATAQIEDLAAAARAADAACGVLVDLEFCEWVDSGVLGVWVSWHHALRDCDGRVVVCRANDRIRNILRVSQLDRLFDLRDTLEDGMRAVAAR